MYLDYQELAESRLVQSLLVVVTLALITAIFMSVGVMWLDEPRVFKNAEGVVRCEVVINGELKTYDATWYEENQDNYHFVEYWVE